MFFLRTNHDFQTEKITRLSRARAQSMNELLIVLVAASIFIFAAGTLIHRGITSDVKKMGVSWDNSMGPTTNSTELQPMSDCTCYPPQGASGWHCGISPCGPTERLISTACIPAGCGESKGIQEYQCVEDTECCDEFRDTIYCGAGGQTPDCPIGSRIMQKVCGQEKVTYECRPDMQGTEEDNSPSCEPHCIGTFSPNEAAAIVNPTLPVVCPGDNTGLESSTGPWIRDKDGIGIQSKLLGSGISVCNQNPSQKCELYCLNGYKVASDGINCEPVSCQKDPVKLNAIISNDEHSQGTSQVYQYKIPNECPITNSNSYITFHITLGEATLQLWNNQTSNWDVLSTSGDNNNLFESLKLYPLLQSDSKYFAPNGQIQWKVTQTPGDKDSFFAKISAFECGHPEFAPHTVIQDPNEALANDTVLLRTFTIPAECSPFNEGSHFTVDVQLINATLQVFDVNNDIWSDVATSGKDNQLFLSLKYHPLGFENRYFKNDQITWRISKADASQGSFQVGLSMAECYQSMCSGVPKEGWVTAMGPVYSCSPLCSSVGLNPGISPEGMSCASGQNRPMSGTGSISYFHDCVNANGMRCNGNLTGPTQTHLSQGNCYRNGQSEDGQLTDIAIACYCK